MKKPETVFVRVELPVFLYVDVEGTNDIDAAKALVWDWLGGGTSIDAPQGFAHARLYTSDAAYCDSSAHFEIVYEGLGPLVGGDE